MFAQKERKLECLNLVYSYELRVGRPKVALLFWFFSNFRCGVPLFIVILVISKYRIGKNRC